MEKHHNTALGLRHSKCQGNGNEQAHNPPVYGARQEPVIDSLPRFLKASFEVNVKGVGEDAADIHNEVLHAGEEKE